MNTLDAVCKLLDAIQQQLVKDLDQAIEFYYHEAEYTLTNPFKQGERWMFEHPYMEMRFEYEWSTFSFVQLCNMVEMMFGYSEEIEFSKELTKQIKETVAERLKKVTVNQVK